MISKRVGKILVTFVCTFALIVFLNGCRKTTEEKEVKEPNVAAPAAEPVEQKPVEQKPVEKQKGPNEPTEKSPAASMTIEPLVGLGPISFGMTAEQVIAQWGQPDKIEADVAMFYLSSRGVSLLLKYRGGVREIQCWSDQYPMQPPDMTIKTFTGKTDKGIGMGATKEQVIAAYGNPNNTVAKGPLETISYDAMKLSFELANGVVVGIRFQAP